MQEQALPAKSTEGRSLRDLASDPRIRAMLGLGFSSGIPFLLVYVTQSAWLSEANVPLGIVGLMSELTLAYKFKFVWAPFLDQYDAPIFSRLLGRRRGWIIVSQIGVALALAGVAFGNPAHWLAWTIVFSLALGFAGATQDIVIDGWRITVAPPERAGLMSSWSEIGWRIGNLVSGAGALYLADAYGWRAAYLCMAACMAPGMIAALMAPEPPSDLKAHVAQGNFVETIFTPIKELLTRLGTMGIPILLLVAGFRMPGYVSSAMAFPLFKHLHYSDSDIATVTKLFGFWVALGGTFLAGLVITRIGIMATLLIGTVFASASHLALAYLAARGGHGHDFWLFATTVSIDSFAYAFASIVLITYMSTLTSTAYAASQYALLTSLCALPGSFLAGTSGFIIERLGFTNFFIATSLIGAPVALLAWYVWRKHLIENGRSRSLTLEPDALGGVEAGARKVYSDSKVSLLSSRRRLRAQTSRREPNVEFHTSAHRANASRLRRSRAAHCWAAPPLPPPRRAVGLMSFRARAQQKVAQSAAQYQASPKNGQQCSTCSHFQAPSSCDAVDGSISPNGWCALYTKKG